MSKACLNAIDLARVSAGREWSLWQAMQFGSLNDIWKAGRRFSRRMGIPLVVLMPIAAKV